VRTASWTEPQLHSTAWEPTAAEADMALWDKLKSELDRAGKAAQGALDEGKTRLEAFRARQQADRAAQALGYAVFRAKQSGTEVDWQTLQRLVNALAEREGEVQRLEKELSANEAKEPENPPPAAG
jgi:hypothetical protein